jgi:mannose-6-phosphate isomerase
MPTAHEAIAAFRAQPRPVKLRGFVQHYDWGGRDFIPSLLRQDNPDGRPFAELWMGCHPNGPTTAWVEGHELPLSELIAHAADEVLGREVAARFQRQLPYLFKVLDARRMLSIQAHPNREQAQQGYERERDARLPPEARNYRDANHKPEVHVALTDFWMLHGFRRLEAIRATLEAQPELGHVMPDFRDRLATAGQDGEARRQLLRELYRTVMTLPPRTVDLLVRRRLEPLLRSRVTDKDDPDYWVLRAALDGPLPDGHYDPGLLSLYLLNLVHLKPGQGTFQPAGTLHAYLEGTNVELMANSDNVLRGGLTSKHVDVSELLRIVDFADGTPDLLAEEYRSPTETIYRTEAEEFQLSGLRVSGSTQAHRGTAHSAEILILLKGEADVRPQPSEPGTLKRGEILLIPAGLTYAITASAAPARLFKASVPARRNANGPTSPSDT